MSSGGIDQGADPVLGVDFGTHRVVAAIIVRDSAVVIPGAQGSGSLDSPGMSTALGFGAAAATELPVVGPAASGALRELALSNPERVVTAIKRLFGRKYESPEVRRHRQDVSYEVVAGRNGDARVRVGRRHYVPAELAAYAIEALKAAAEDAAGGPITRAIFTVPALFNALQRQALHDAARIAGLEVIGMLTEPAAAALGAGLVEGRKHLKVVVYDLGGGSFDVAALNVAADEVQVVATGGDGFLGGDDFDQRIVSYVCDEIVKATGTDLRRNPRALAKLKGEAERAKRELSMSESTTIQVRDIGGAGRVAAVVTLTRERLEGLVQDLVSRTVWPCEAVLRDAEWSVDEVDAVLLVGGAARMPAIRRQVVEVFGKDPVDVMDPETLVAIGAARQGAALASRRRRAVRETVSVSLGYESAGGLFARLIPRGTELPAERSHLLTPAADGQAPITLHLLQGEREMAVDNDSIAQLLVGPPATRSKASGEVELTVAIDGRGLPQVSARDPGTGQARVVRLRATGGLTETEVVALAAAHAAQAEQARPDRMGGEVPDDAAPVAPEAAEDDMPALVSSRANQSAPGG